MKKVFTLITGLTMLVGTLQAQINYLGQDFGAGEHRVVLSHVPMLLITPDAQAAGMGDMGVATAPSANDIFWNPAKMSFHQSKFAVNVGRNPWLRTLFSGVNFYSISGHYKLSEGQAIGLSLRHFSGITSFNGVLPIFDENARDIALDLGYSTKLSKHLGIGVVAKYVHSRLYRTDAFIGGVSNDFQNGKTFAVDLALFYSKPVKVMGTEAKFKWGINVSNLGPKVSYSDTQAEFKYFIPTNLRIGTSLQFSLAPNHQLLVGTDLNKLLVPTPPAYDDQFNIVKGTDPNEKNTLQGILGSFGDAPDGFSEELQEFTWALGVAYQYKNWLSVRTGTFREHRQKGNRKYLTLGLGVKIVKKVNLNTSYVLSRRGDPLNRTFRLSAGFEL